MDGIIKERMDANTPCKILVRLLGWMRAFAFDGGLKRKRDGNHSICFLVLRGQTTKIRRTGSEISTGERKRG